MVVIAAECSLLSVPPLVLDNFSNPLVLVYFFNYCDKLRMSALLKKKKEDKISALLTTKFSFNSVTLEARSQDNK